MIDLVVYDIGLNFRLVCNKFDTILNHGIHKMKEARAISDLCTMLSKYEQMF